MKHLLFLCFLIAPFCYPQDKALMPIIEADVSLEIRQQKIDSLLKIKALEKPTETLADFYHDLGSKWYFNNWWDHGNKDDIEKAIFYTRKALDIKKGQDNLQKASLERTLYNLGYFSYLNYDMYRAMDFYLSLIDTGKENRLVQKANMNLGTLYMSVGDYYKALDRFNDYVAFCHSAEGVTESEKEYLAEVYILKADVYSQMGIQDFTDEIHLNLSKADSILKRGRNPNADLYYTRINQLEGNSLLKSENYTEAIASYNKVLQDSTNLFPEELARVYNSLAASQIQLQEFDKAKISLAQSTSLDPNYAEPFNNLGDIYSATHQPKKALYYYQKAIIYAVDKKKEIKYDDRPTVEELELSSDKISLLGHLVTKANGWLKYYTYDSNKDHLDQALKTFALADRLVDIIRSESTEYQSKLFWREKGASLYMKAVEVCYLLDKPEEAYYFMERNKALLLLEDISNEQAKEMVNLPNTVAEREFELKRAIFLSENEFKNLDTASSDSLESGKRKVYKNKRTYNTFVDSLTKAFPEYANIKKKVDVLPYPDFKRNYISDDEVVLQYILNDEQGYGLLTAKDETVFFKLAAVDTLNEKIITLYGQLTDLTTDRHKMETYNRLSNQVFKQLVPRKVHKKINGKKLTIITDYILQQIPFEAFVVNDDSTSYLIEDAEIRYAYSMSYLEAKKHVTVQAEKEYFGLAPVQFASLGLPELLFSSTEVEEAEKIFSGDLALNGEATKAKFLENIDDSRIVHLSTHADVGEDADPWIAFNDEKMFLDEIYATKNQAEMVVLSACNTSIGELKKGEGAMSLARGFFHSGAKSVVSSLWSTNDKSSKELMVAFYKGLDKGLTKSAALRRAKLDYIDKYRGSAISPAYWSALIVIGDNSPMASAGTFSSLWVWALLGTLVLIALYFIGKRFYEKPAS